MKKFKRFQSSVLFIAVVLILSLGCEPSGFRFVFMTDIHVQPERHAAEGFRAAIEKANSLRPDFVITGGDLIMDALGQSYGRADSLYDLYESLIQNFRMPVYNTLGNHEVFGLYEKSGVSPEHAEFGKEMFKKRLGNGRTYYSFDHKGWHFIVLDGIGITEDRRYFGFIDSVQVEWLKEDLAGLSKDTPVVVSTHIPFVTVFGQMTHGGTYAMSESSVITNGKPVLELLDDYNLKLVLQGHLHILEDIFYEGTHYITGGAVSAAWWTGPRDGFPEGFVVIDVKGHDFSWSYETFGWQAKVEETPAAAE